MEVFSNFHAGKKTSNVKIIFSNKKRKKLYNYLKFCRVKIPISIASRAGANVMASRYLKTAIKKEEYVSLYFYNKNAWHFGAFVIKMRNILLKRSSSSKIQDS